MAHARQTIREAIATLVTGLTTTGANVFQSRVYNVQESELPCLLVYTVSEAIDEDPRYMGDPRHLHRTLTVTIEGKVRAVTDMDDTLDTIGEEVEIAIAGVAGLGIGVHDTILDSVDIDYTNEGDQPIGSVVMNYNVMYFSAEDAPGTIL